MPGAAVNRRFRTGVRHDAQKIAPKGASGTARGRALGHSKGIRHKPRPDERRLILRPDRINQGIH